jgi:hypothetical protein
VFILAQPLFSHIFLSLNPVVASSVKWGNDAFFAAFIGLRQASEPLLSHLLIADNNTIPGHFTGLL